MERKSIMKKGKVKKLSNLIYASKLKSNVIGHKIRKKTHNLIENHTGNDLN